MKYIKTFENERKYKVGDNIIIEQKNKKYNAKIVSVSVAQDMYPYAVMTIPYRDISNLPIAFDKYGNIVYYIRNYHIVNKITDEKISKKINDEYEKIVIEGESKKYNL